MEGFNLGDLISLIIVFALYLFAASGRTKKGKNSAQSRRKRSPMRTRAQGEQADKRAFERDRQTNAGFGDAFETGDMHGDAAQKPCDGMRIHLHEVAQQQFAEAVEGEDPCHAGGVSETDEPLFETQQDTEREAFAHDVLRGVIMSEILTRPHERAALRRGGR